MRGYPSHQTRIQADTTWYSLAVSYPGSNQARRCLSKIIVLEPMFRHYMAISREEPDQTRDLVKPFEHFAYLILSATKD